MKKILAIMLAAAMIFAMSACGTKEEEASVQNPWVTYDSLEALNEHFGCKLAHPGVMGVTDESFSGLETENSSIAQYKFTVGGYEYCLRYSPDFEKDISGIYVGKGTMFDNAGTEANVSTESYKGSRWINVDGQYCLTVEDNNKLDAATFESLASELEDLTFPGLTESEKQTIYDNLAGEYQDSFSGRATMDLTSAQGGVKALVHWGSSASEADTWEMTLTLGEDGLFNYTDGTHSRITWDEKGNENVEELAKDQCGYFEQNEKGDLLWTGAADEDCRECVFAQ